MNDTPPKTRWSLVIHGGAGQITRERLKAGAEAAVRDALGRALDSGSAILAQGGSALDAVEAAVRVLEEDPSFNAGRGSALTYDGRVEMDAAVMDGRDRSAGAAAGLTTIRSPVAAARAVMERSPHVLLSGGGAERFAIDVGLEQADPDWFVTAERRHHLNAMRARDDWFDAEMKYGTVGAVALDADGHVAAATSTGGVTGKRWGRIGDSPLIGAGTYADDRACAISATGTGETFIRAGAGHEIAARIRLSGEAAQVAADAVLAEIGGMGGTGGVIFVTPTGEAGWSFISPGMYRGRADAGGRQVAIFGDE